MLIGNILLIRWYDNEWGYSNKVVDLIKYIQLFLNKEPWSTLRNQVIYGEQMTLKYVIEAKLFLFHRKQVLKKGMVREYHKMAAWQR